MIKLPILPLMQHLEGQLYTKKEEEKNPIKN